MREHLSRPNPSGSSPGAGWFGWVCAAIAVGALALAFVAAFASNGGSC